MADITKDPPQPQQKLEFTPPLMAFSVVLLPCIIIFDVIAYMLQRNACMSCGDVPTFIQQSSLAAQIVGQFWSTLRTSIQKV